MPDLDNIQNNIYYNEKQKVLIAEKDYTTVDDGVRHHDVEKEYDDGRKFEREGRGKEIRSKSRAYSWDLFYRHLSKLLKVK